MAIEDQCLQLAMGGDRSAQRIIYESLVDWVHRVVLRLVGHSHADDITQEVFIQVFTKLHSYRGAAEFSTWVHRIAINEALQHLRRVKRRATVPLLTEPAELRGGGNASEWSDLLEQAFSRIDGESRVILELKEVEGFSYAKIAHLLEIPEGTVGSRLNKARRELRQQLVALGWEG